MIDRFAVSCLVRGGQVMTLSSCRRVLVGRYSRALRYALCLSGMILPGRPMAKNSRPKRRETLEGIIRCAADSPAGKSSIS